MSPSAIIAVTAEQEDLADRAAALAADLSLPLLDQSARPSHVDLLLVVTHRRVELREPAGPAIWAEFLSGRFGHRLNSPGQGASMLRRAVGFKGRPWQVADATAGLCRDAFLLAVAGCDVLAIERSPVIAALVKDGLDRARSADEQPVRDAVERIRFVVSDARNALADCRFDAVYLDPMFPARNKSALVKKEMRICRLVAGEDPDAGGLLDLARLAARSRVVVKRPIHAPPLAGQPAFTLPGRTIRYDVYLPAQA